MVQDIVMEEFVCSKCSSKFKLMKKKGRPKEAYKYCGSLCAGTHQGLVPEAPGALQRPTFRTLRNSRNKLSVEQAPDYDFYS